jgi:hypothetical protein
MRRVVGDGHREDVLVREPARLRRQQSHTHRGAQPHEAEPGGAEQVLDGAARHHVGAQRPHVDLERAERLIAVGEDDGAVLVAELRDRAHVVAMP